MKKAWRQASSAVLCTLFFLTGFTQSNFKPGKIVSATGDTISGLLYNAAIDRNPVEIYFTTGPNAQRIKYTPADIRAFVTEDRIFRTAIVTRNAEPPQPVPTDPVFVLVQDTVFVEVLVDGKKSLASYRDRQNISNFYVGSDTGYQLLRFKQFLRSNSNDQTFIVAINLFRNQLADYLDGCADIDKAVSAADYNQDDLLKLFNTYFKCRHVDVSYVQTKKRNKPEAGVLLGATITQLKFEGPDIHSQFDFASSTGVTAGLFLDLILPRHLTRFSINNELTYSAYSTESSTRYQDPLYSQYEYNDLRRLKLSYIKLNNMLRYRIPIKMSSVFANAGITNGMVLSETNYSRIETIRFGTPSGTKEGKAIEDLKKYEFGWLAGIGATFKRFRLEARMEKANGMLKAELEKSRVTRYTLLAGFRF